MSYKPFGWQQFSIRLVFSTILVFATYNPTPYCFFRWAIEPVLSEPSSFTVYQAMVGVILLIGWTIFLRATHRSLGLFGTLLAVAFAVLLLWLIVDVGLVSFENRDAMSYLALSALSIILAIGLSWSHIRRRMTGQMDVDDVDD